MVEDSRSDDSDFCREMQTRYGLTPDQMHRAAERYRLGRSKSGKTIFWMVDDLGICRDGHIATSWVSTMLKLRYPTLAHYVHPRHCFFGLHLLTEKSNCHTERTEITERATPNHAEDNNFCDFCDFCVTNIPIGVVESERSAVILSEACPDLLWLAYAYPSNLTVDQFAPLRGLTVTLFPRADPDEFLAALELADQVKRTYRDIDISVSSFLEDHASPDQKSRNIDLVDFLFNL